MVKVQRNQCQSVGTHPPDDVALAVERPGLVIHVPVDSETEAGIEHVQLWLLWNRTGWDGPHVALLGGLGAGQLLEFTFSFKKLRERLVLSFWGHRSHSCLFVVSVHRRGIEGKCPVVGMRNAERDNMCLSWVSGVKSDMPKEEGVDERDRQEGGSKGRWGEAAESAGWGSEEGASTRTADRGGQGRC